MGDCDSSKSTPGIFQFFKLTSDGLKTKQLKTFVPKFPRCCTVTAIGCMGDEEMTDAIQGFPPPKTLPSLLPSRYYLKKPNVSESDKKGSKQTIARQQQDVGRFWLLSVQAVFLDFTIKQIFKAEGMGRFRIRLRERKSEPNTFSILGPSQPTRVGAQKPLSHFLSSKKGANSP